jgi:ATP-dependent DNA helicase RecQ
VTDLRPALRELYGFDDFRPGQEAVVRAALDSVDTLAVMPTGAGKSLTYQLAAMLRPAPTLVLSPLIALMKDQVDKLPARIGATATFVNSSLGPDEAAARLASVAAGETRLLYAAPERLRQEAFVRTLRSIGVGLVVIDEVHCVSMWGHDFRPDYLFIRRALDELDRPAVLGMTATATPANADAIGQALGRRLELVRTSVHRPNLRYDVERAENAENRLRGLLRRLRELPDGGVAIVYARSRRSCEEIARTLRGHGIRAEHYHAGLEPEERTRVQESFVDGRTPVVVATTAFGMGIDKANVRLVALVNFPDSLESYVQMVGRAGRDGRPSDTVLFAGDADAAALRRFALGGVPTPELLRAVYRTLREARGAVEPEDLDEAVRGSHDPRVLVGMLEQAGIVRRGYDAGRAMRVELLPVEAGAGGSVDALLDRYGREAAARVEQIVSFAEVERCRHLQVAEHFGETLESPCGACDVCAPRDARRAEPAPAAAPLPEDPARTIVDAVDGLTWPLGRRSLVAMLRGSVKAPPSARRSPAFGSLGAASDAEVTRWVRALEVAGALVEVSSDGFRVLHARPELPLPSLAAPVAGGEAGPIVAELRAWRSRRASEDGVPAYVVLHDATLRELAARLPRSPAELAVVKGLGPTKVERYGDELLELLSTA